TRNGRHDIKLLAAIGQHQRLVHDHASHFATEVVLEGTIVDGDAARTRAQEHTRGRRLAAASAVVLSCCHSQIASSLGCCEACGCSAPAYTLSLRPMARPRGLCG